MTEERMKILKMIEEGKITADEGAKLLEAVERKPEEDKEKPASKRYGLRNFFDDAVEKVKKSDFDMVFGEYQSFSEEAVLEAGEMNDIDVWIANGSLVLRSWDQDYVKAVFDGRVYGAESEQQAKDRFQEDVNLTLKAGLLRLSSPVKKTKVKVELYVPPVHLSFIKAKLSNGDLEIEELKADQLQLKTSNGPVKLKELIGRSCKVETGNGSITAASVNFEEWEADTINGTVSLVGDLGKSDISTVSGQIKVDHLSNKAHTGFYKTTAGSIRVSIPNERKIVGLLKSNIGNVYCELENYKILKDKKDVMNKRLEFEAYEQYDQTYHIEAETKTGPVTVTPPSIL